MQGIDPRTSYMLSKRSTIWATSPQPFENRCQSFIALISLPKQYTVKPSELHPRNWADSQLTGRVTLVVKRMQGYSSTI